MNNLDKQYLSLVKDILENGVEKKDRTGTGTLSLFGKQIRHNMSEGFPLLTTKKLNFKNIWTELVWFLKGSTHIKYLLDNDNYIWVGDAYKNYRKNVNNPVSKKDFIESVKKGYGLEWTYGYLGDIYGKQWRDSNGIDQIQVLIDTLISNPDSRRMLVSAWNVGDLDTMVLPPCHYSFQVYTRELSHEERLNIYMMTQTTFDTSDIKTPEKLDQRKVPKRSISLIWNQRSVDTGLGLPYNIASYGLLLIMLGQEVGMIPEELIGNLGDTHIYLDQVDGLKEQLKRGAYKLPKLSVQDGIFSNSEVDFKLENYTSHPSIKLPLSN